jgi:glycosyltransferase involved in cell wall biosynthesis
MPDAVDPIRSPYLTGRLPLAQHGALLELSIDGVTGPGIAAGRKREFSIPLPQAVFDGAVHEVSIRVAGEPTVLSGCPLRFQSNYQGYVQMEPFAGPLLTGWARDLSRPGTPLAVEILLHGRPIAVVSADRFCDDFPGYSGRPGRCGFSFRIEGLEQLDRSSVIRARIAGTQFDLRGSPVLYLDTSRFLTTIHNVNSAFRFLNERTAGGEWASGPGIELSQAERTIFTDLFLGGGNLAEMMELSRWFQEAASQHIAAATERHRFYTYLSGSFAGCPTIRHAAADPHTDIIVHSAAAHVRAVDCLGALLASAPETPFTVIYVLDGNPDPGFRARLEAQAAGRDVIFLENRSPRGFAASFNAAALLHRERDVVALDANTLVAGDWLRRLRASVDRAPAAGIVTPFTTAGEICNYTGAAAPQHSLHHRDALSMAANGDSLLDIPAIQGVCSFIRRSCLDEVGPLEEGTFQTRGAALIDFCVRAANRGWRILLAAGVLVESAPEELESAADRQALDRSHPFFADLLVNFQLDDPALPLRREIDIAVLRNLQRPVYCFLTHRFGGGTERHIRDLCAALDSEGIEPIVLFALDGRRVSIVLPRLDALASLHYRLESELRQLFSDLSRLNIQEFHIHSNIAIPDELMQLPSRLGIPYDCTVHDYSWFCPRVNLIDESGIYCGEPSLAACEDCIRHGDAGLWREFSATHRSVAELRSKSHAILSSARKVFCPSLDTKLRMARQFELTNLELRIPLEPPSPPPAPRSAKIDASVVNVGLIGFISRKKGMEILRQCALSAVRGALPLRFIVVGFTENDASFQGLPNVLITGRYQEGEAANLLRDHEVHLALFPTICPETHSYALSIALHAGLYPVAFDLGAIAERIRAGGFGRLLPLETPPEEIDEVLLECSGRDRVVI